MANRIPKWQLQEMFDDIAAKTDWNLDGEMVWGYFFTDSDRSVLELAATKLESEGYRFVDLFQPEDGENVLPYYFLHVERNETHDVNSLYERNTDLEAFAKENGLDTYDGMDVGPVTDRLPGVPAGN
jgi:Regulator of ribonuclease activity B